MLFGVDVAYANRGLAQAGTHLGLEASGDVMNIGGDLVSKGSAQFVAGGSFGNITEIERKGSGENYQDTMGRKGRVIVQDRMQVDTAGDYVTIASVTDVGSFDAHVAGNMMIAAGEVGNASAYSSSGGHSKEVHTNWPSVTQRVKSEMHPLQSLCYWVLCIKFNAMF